MISKVILTVTEEKLDENNNVVETNTTRTVTEYKGSNSGNKTKQVGIENIDEIFKPLDEINNKIDDINKDVNNLFKRFFGGSKKN